ncbi:hypothetical protein E4K66_27765 [Bradyrhizobium frederickii]|uniref:Uncharacterized protein n=1 Tax=Bradyrhizobium frederickii TaxID=2560054 RepID=A0A4Y9KVX8_9BRAD|nr:hypothetical protein E4K66_27765 [Bradyrhizobium frederickii]
MTVRDSTSSLRAQRSNPESLRGKSLDCFVARAPRNDGAGSARPSLTSQFVTSPPAHPAARSQARLAAGNAAPIRATPLRCRR